MPVMTYEQIYASLSAEQKSLLDNIYTEHPELKNGWLRQDDYSRKQNELREAVAYKERMEPWAQQAYERIHQAEEAGLFDENGNVVWDQKVKDYERQIEEARKAALAGGDMKPEEIDARVREIIKANGGSVSADEYKALIAEESRKVAQAVFGEEWKNKEADFNTKTIPFVAGFSTSMAVIASRYERETGEKWTAETQAKAYELMSKENNFDPFKMEETLLAPYREKKSREQEIQAGIAKGIQEQRERMGETNSFRSGPPSTGMGALQRAMSAPPASGSQSADLDLQDLVLAGVVESAKQLDEGK